MPVPTQLRIEHRPRPLGIGYRQPRLSWWLPPGATRQMAYEIEAVIDGTEWATGPIEDDEPILRPWPFPELGSRSRVSWRVRVHPDLGWSDWSGLDEFETGLLETSDWQARFIGASPEGVLYLRKRFHVSESPGRARVYATAHGIYELHLDGIRVGDLELTPGFTAYRSHLEAQTYDITLTPGEHELVATVTDGWWRGATGSQQRDRCYGDSLELLAQVEIDGRIVIATDDSWEMSQHGPIVAADLMRGQQTDQTVDFQWAKAQVLGDPDTG